MIATTEKQAQPAALVDIRCSWCRRLLGKALISGVVEIKCRDCKSMTVFRK